MGNLKHLFILFFRRQLIPNLNCFFIRCSDDDYKDDDIIFEDFARLRLKGETEA